MQTTKKVLTLFTVVVYLLVVSSTNAAITPRQFQESMNVAQQTFPNSPCQGKVQLHAGMASLDAYGYTLDLVLQQAGVHVGGLAVVDGSCQIFMVATLEGNPTLWCTVLVHEYGHLAGYPHSNTGVMQPQALKTYPPCQAAIPTVMPGEARKAAATLLVQRYPVADGSMRIRCQRRDRLKMVCWGQWTMLDTGRPTGWFAVVIWRQEQYGTELHLKTRNDLGYHK
jgi:hypothetical protein